MGEPQNRGGDDMTVITVGYEESSVPTRPHGGGFQGETTSMCNSVRPLVLPAPFVSSWAVAAAVAAAYGTGGAGVRA